MKQTAMLNKNFDEPGDSWACSPRSKSVSAPHDTRHSRSTGNWSAWNIGQMIVERQVNTSARLWGNLDHLSTGPLKALQLEKFTRRPRLASSMAFAAEENAFYLQVPPIGQNSGK